MGDFVHLHNHSHYSLQDGACTVESLIEAAKRNDMHALALTDHGVMFGASEFYKIAKKEGIKPILGMEAYIVMDGSRFDRGKDNPGGRKKSKHYNHLLLLAKNLKGYKNLMKLSTLGHSEGFYYKPRIDLDLLRGMSEGLVCTSACIGGPVSSHLVNGNYDKAHANSILLSEIFGDDFYLEIQDHGMEEDQIILEGVPKIAKNLGINLVATNDIHYIEREHSIAHNILLLLSDKTGTKDYKELRYKTDQIYFKSTEEMKQLFLKYDGAIENSLAIEEKIDLNIDFSEFHYPQFPIPDDAGVKSIDEYFAKLARAGLEKKISKLSTEIEDRFNYEVDVIQKMGYSGYFLITQDFINAAKKRGIPVGPGRGSVAGSLAAYALGITNVNPLEYNLLFERFLNPARKSMPDIDVDFADDQRGEIIDYVKDKYGETSVSQIITFNRLSSKAVIRDVARVLKIPIPTVNSITKWIPSKFGRVFTIDQALKEVPELRWVRDSEDPAIQDLIKYSKILEGMNRNSSKHAAGVVITPGEVSEFVPLARAGSEGDLVTQYNMKELDAAGILKMDFLGLRTLTIIRDTIEMVKKTRGIEIDIENIPVGDKKTYEMFSKGQTTALFQFESPPMREYLKRLKPASINDLAAMNALYRPGPMDFIDDFIARKNGSTKFEYQHPILEDILNETYGIIVYQEQVIQIANRIGGMSLAEADLLRRAMGKKDLLAMKEQKEKFISGAVKKNITNKIADEIFQAIDKFANYGFNKSHAVAYSIVSYQTAYLKAHYLSEFLAANLTNEFGNSAKVTSLLEDCRKLKVKVLPPDINNPSGTFNVLDGIIRFGMSAIKNVGKGAVAEIMKSRKKLGRDFTSIYDFCSHVDTRVVNKRAVEGMVLAGAMDSLKGKRSQNFAAVENALQFGNKVQNAKAKNTNTLFGSSNTTLNIVEPELPDIPAWDMNKRLAKEREVLGFYLSDHPLRKYETEYNSFATVHLGEPQTFKDNNYVRACGVITDLRTKIDRSGKNMAFFTMDDFSGSCECLMFSKIFSEFGKHILLEGTVMVKGTLESSGDTVKIHTEEIYPLSEVRKMLTKKLVLVYDTSSLEGDVIAQLKDIFEKHPGEIPVYLLLKDNGDQKDFYLDFKINLSDKFVASIKNILGEESIRYLSV